jgi:hypothetical protein
VTFAPTAGARRQAHDSEDRRIAVAPHVKPHRIDVMGLDEESLLSGGDRDERPGCHPADGIVALRRYATHWRGAPAGIGGELGAAGLESRM